MTVPSEADNNDMQREDDDTLEEGIIVYEESASKQDIFATGAWGGPTPMGTAVVGHLYVEGTTMPNYTTHEITEDGRLNLTAREEIKKGTFTRKVTATLMLPPETAVSIGRWLIEKGEAAMELRETMNQVSQEEGEGDDVESE